MAPDIGRAVGQTDLPARHIPGARSAGAARRAEQDRAEAAPHTRAEQDRAKARVHSQAAGHMPGAAPCPEEAFREALAAFPHSLQVHDVRGRETPAAPRGYWSQRRPTSIWFTGARSAVSSVPGA